MHGAGATEEGVPGRFELAVIRTGSTPVSFTVTRAPLCSYATVELHNAQKNYDPCMRLAVALTVEEPFSRSAPWLPIRRRVPSCQPGLMF